MSEAEGSALSTWGRERLGTFDRGALRIGDRLRPVRRDQATEKPIRLGKADNQADLEDWIESGKSAADVVQREDSTDPAR